MALAEQLSIDRLRAGARATARHGADLARRRPRPFAGRPARDVRPPRRWAAPGAAAVVGCSAVLLPWAAVLLARLVDPVLHGGRIVSDPWSVLSPAWGAWSLLGLLVAAVFALVAWARLQSTAPDLSRTAIVALASLVAFALWCGASVFLWSDSPSGAWQWTVLALGVALAPALGAFVGAQPSGRRGIVVGLLVTGTLTAVIGLVDLLAFPGEARRIVSPLDPTATGLIVGLGVLVALALDQNEHPQRRRWLRAAATLGLVALVLGASRSAIAVTAIGLVLLSLRGVAIGWPLLQALGGALPASVMALLATGVARAGEADTTSRAIVAALLALGVLAVAWSAARDLGAPAPVRRVLADRRIWVGVGVAGVLAIVGAAALSEGGIRGTWDRATDTFSARSVPGQPADGSRLWNATSDGHLWRWQAALDAYQQQDDPIFGIGPGTSAQTLRRYRRDTTGLLTTPSAPIATLTEAGAVGLALVIIGFLGLSVAARRERRLEPRSDGALLLTIGSVVFLHALVNDDHLQPLVLFPALVAVGALIGRPSVEQLLGPPPAPNSPPLRRSVATAFGVVLAVVVAFGALVPARAQLKARSAEAALTRGDGASLRDASLFSSQAAQLDPLNFQGQAIGAQSALALQRWTDARRLALEAVRRAPREAAAWRAVALVALAEHDRPGARTAARKLLELDPASPTTRAIAIQATLDSAPPEASPTAVGTPLTPLGG